MADIFLDHKFIGSVKDPREFVTNLIAERRQGKLNHDLNVLYDDVTDSVFLETAKGRSVRPLIVVKNGKPLLTEEHIKQLQAGQLHWNDLLAPRDQLARYYWRHDSTRAVW